MISAARRVSSAGSKPKSARKVFQVLSDRLLRAPEGILLLTFAVLMAVLEAWRDCCLESSAW